MERIYTKNDVVYVESLEILVTDSPMESISKILSIFSKGFKLYDLSNDKLYDLRDNQYEIFEIVKKCYAHNNAYENVEIPFLDPILPRIEILKKEISDLYSKVESGERWALGRLNECKAELDEIKIDPQLWHDRNVIRELNQRRRIIRRDIKNGPRCSFLDAEEELKKNIAEDLEITEELRKLKEKHCIENMSHVNQHRSIKFHKLKGT